MKYSLLFLFTLLPMLAHSVDRERSTIRCNGGFVKKAMSKYKVIDLCGKPLDSEVISGQDEVKIENIIYKFKQSSTAPLIIFTFRAGILIKITETS